MSTTRNETSKLIVDRRFNLLVAAGSTTLFSLIVASVWGQWATIAALVVLQACRTIINKKGQDNLTEETADVWGERLATANLIVNFAFGFLCHFTLATLLYMPFQLLVTENYGLSRARILRAFIVLGMVIPAWMAGIAPLTLLSLAFLAAFTWAVSRTRVQIIHEAVDSLRAKHRDIDEAHQRLREMHDRMLEQEKLAALGVLAAGIAHEINNPMAFVTGNVSALARDIQSFHREPELIKEYAEEVLPATVDGIGRVNTIVSDLRRFARQEQGEFVEYDLNREVHTVLRMARGQIMHRRIELELGELPTMVGRPQQIAQLLLNLIVNAAQATREDGVVAVSTRAEGADVVIRVKDDGIGMTPETRRRLFQPFFTTKPVGQGTGLGLAVVHGVVNVHGGHIDVESEPGQGACFTVRLPRRAAPARPRAGSIIETSVPAVP